ncbi:MAG: GNAT family N-acetyltransferase [Anaerolineales bacterium]|nr:GNAT family N-acetyltransferase [Anaerolineales bacterium]
MGSETPIPYSHLQAYLRHSAHQQYAAVPLPPFTLFFHPNDNFEHFNYAIPDEPAGGDLATVLAELCRVFTARGCTPRFEFMERYAPELPEALRQAGFFEEARQHMMVCVPDAFQAAPPVPGLVVEVLAADAPIEQAVDFLAVQRLGFDPNSKEGVTSAEAETFLKLLGAGRAFVARMAGEPVSVGVYNAPHDGLTELAGIATLPDYRRRGIGTALTAQMLVDAFANGVEVAILTAEDERAGRVYERVGFIPYTTMLAYRLP